MRVEQIGRCIGHWKRYRVEAESSRHSHRAHLEQLSTSWNIHSFSFIHLLITPHFLKFNTFKSNEVTILLKVDLLRHIITGNEQVESFFIGAHVLIWNDKSLHTHTTWKRQSVFLFFQDDKHPLRTSGIRIEIGEEMRQKSDAGR